MKQVSTLIKSGSTLEGVKLNDLWYNFPMVEIGSQYLNLSTVQAINKLRVLLEHADDAKGGVRVRLDNAETLEWEGWVHPGASVTAKVLKLLYERRNRGVKNPRPDAAVLDLTSSAHNHGNHYARV